ncbi:MAG: hypothetical protein ABJN36_19335 [Cyclobacteriaceae bacterium]|uniref:hypothetical protein n=1 Tax=Reichenbachiella sp. TaxID=2184521 RepID=UPI0032656874
MKNLIKHTFSLLFIIAYTSVLPQISGPTVVAEGTTHSYTMDPAPPFTAKWYVTSGGSFVTKNSYSATLTWTSSGTIAVRNGLTTLATLNVTVDSLPDSLAFSSMMSRYHAYAQEATTDYSFDLDSSCRTGVQLQYDEGSHRMMDQCTSFTIDDTYIASQAGAIDNLKFHTVDTQMSTYIYKPLVGLTSSTDPMGRTTFLCYDEWGRFLYTKDQEGNATHSIEYHY